MIYFPLTLNWDFCGKISLNDLEQSGTDEDACGWIQNAYRWLYDRLPESQRSRLSLPISNVSVSPSESYYIPFPTVYENREDDGVLVFMKVGNYGNRDVEKAEHETENAISYAHNAALYVFDLFRKMNPDIGNPEIIIERDDLTGSSLSLAA